MRGGQLLKKKIERTMFCKKYEEIISKERWIKWVKYHQQLELLWAWHGHWIWWFRVYTWQWKDLFQYNKMTTVQLKQIQEKPQVENVNHLMTTLLRSFGIKRSVELQWKLLRTAEAVSWNNKWQGMGFKEQVEGMRLGNTLIT